MAFVRRCLDAYPADAVWLVAALEDIQAGLGYVPVDAVTFLARRFGLSPGTLRADIEASEAFRCTPPPAHVLHVCRGPFCAAAGADALRQCAEAVAGEEADVGCVAGHCLGHCPDAPVVMLDGVVARRVRPDDVRRMLSPDVS